MDAYDKSIAFELMDNSRQTLRQLSSKIGLTAPSIKKRIDRLIEVGFIKQFIVYLDDKYIRGTAAILLVRTDGTANLEQFIERIQDNQIIFLILPLISGELFLRVFYIEPQELSEFVEMLSGYDGVVDVEVHTTRVHEGEGDLSDFTTTQLKILSQLAVDPRMPTHEIAARAGLSIKKVNQKLETLVEENMIRFGMKWNRHGKGTFVALGLIKYNPNMTTSEYITDWLTLRYPIEFWYTRVSTEKPVVFAIFGVSDILFLETLMKDIQKQKWQKSISILTGSSSKNLDIPHITKLIDMLTSQGLWPAVDLRG